MKGAAHSDNYNSPGLFAPSGSGALEPRDLHGSKDLQTLVMNGANRELREEAGTQISEILDSRVLGHGRWLSKGGMPEFYGYTLLTVASDELDLRDISRGERRFTGERFTVRLPPREEWVASDPQSILGERASSASIPLLCAISVLADLVLANDPSVKPLVKLLEALNDATTEAAADDPVR